MTPKWLCAAAAALATPARRRARRAATVAATSTHFVRDWEWTGRRPRTRAELDAVRALRPTLDQLWTGRRRTKRSRSSTPCCVTRRPAAAGAARRLGLPPARDPGRTRRSPTGWRSRPRWPSSTWSGWASSTGCDVCAADDCDGPARRPVQEPLAALLLHYLFQPHERARPTGSGKRPEAGASDRAPTGQSRHCAPRHAARGPAPRPRAGKSRHLAPRNAAAPLGSGPAMHSGS